MERKKRVVIATDYPLLRTGLAKNGRELAIHLHKTGKYEILYYACGVPWDNPEYQRFPWKTLGAMPNNMDELGTAKNDQNYLRAVSYGNYYIDRIITDFKPDVVIASNDSWAFPWTDKFWLDKINCAFHVTIDSLPLLPDQKALMKKGKDFFVWADFAEDEAKRLGFNHVKTLTGIINPKSFFKLPKLKRIELRKSFNIPSDAFVVGFVFRNQLRKEIRVLLEGFKDFKKSNPEVKNAFLLLHTNFTEGWDILRMMEEFGIKSEEVLTTYVCRNCKEMEVKPFKGNDLDCPFCRVKGTPQGTGQANVTVNCGISDEQLNEVYNLMDVYVHPMNCGGLEIPMVESLYCELPLATVDYSSGSKFCKNSFVSKIDFAWTTQFGTTFNRAAPYSSSVAKILKKYYFMEPPEREGIGKEGRSWALTQFSPEVVGKKWEDYIDNAPLVIWDFQAPKPDLKNPDASIPEIADNTEWVKTIYREILKMNVTDDDSGKRYWEGSLAQGMKREDILNYFRTVARQENAKLGTKNEVKIEDLFDQNGKKKFLLVCKESAGDLLNVSALLKSFRDSYPSETWDLYLACDPQYFDIFDGNKYLTKVIPYQSIFESEIACTGSSGNKGFVDGYCYVAALSQKFLSYLTHDKIQLQLQD